jgi:hypothetical protein
MRFNPPPNWPALPADFTPPAGWQPDPRWGAVPYGWPLWIDDSAPVLHTVSVEAAVPPLTAEAPLLTPVPPDVRRSWLARNWGIPLTIVILVVGAIVAFNYHKHQVKLAGHQVVYTVTTSDGATAFDIVYVTAGGSQQATNVATPWTYSAGLRAIGSTAALYLSAQNSVTGSGSITCTITVDGAVAASNTSSGAAAIATCEAVIH